MKLFKHLGAILLIASLSQVLALSAIATDKQSTTPNASNNMASKDDLSAQKELFQVQLDAKKELLQKDIEAQAARIDAFEKRIDDQNNRIGDIDSGVARFTSVTGLLGILITVFLVGIGFLGYKTAKNDAKEEAKVAASQWFEDNHSKLISQMEELENRATQASQSIDDHTKEVAQRSSETQARMKELEKSLEEEAQAQMQIFQNRMTQDRTTGQFREQFSTNNSAIEQQSEKLKQKPESEYTFTDWNTRAFAALSEGKFEDAIFYWDKAISSPDILPQARAQTLFNKGVTLGQVNRSEEEIATYDALITKFGSATELALQEKVAKAMYNKGYRLNQLNHSEEALAVVDALISQFGSATELTLREQVAKAMHGKGVTLGQLNRNEEAIETYDLIISQFGPATELALREQVAKAMHNKGYRLNQLNRGEEEIATYDALITQFGSTTELALREPVAKAMLNKGYRLGQLNRSEEAIATYDELIEQFRSATELALREKVAMAMVNKGITLSQVNRSEEAIAAYDAVITQFGSSEELTLREQVAQAMVNKGYRLGQLNHSEEAIAAYDAVITQFGSSEELTLREQVAQASNGKCFNLLCRAKANWDNPVLANELLAKASDACKLAISKNSENGLAHGNFAYISWLQGDAVAAEQHFKTGLASTKNGGETLYKGTLTDFDIHPIEPDKEFRALVEKLWEEYQAE